MSAFKEMQSKNVRRFVFKQYFHISLLSMTALKWGPLGTARNTFAFRHDQTTCGTN